MVVAEPVFSRSFRITGPAATVYGCVVQSREDGILSLLGVSFVSVAILLIGVRRVLLAVTQEARRRATIVSAGLCQYCPRVRDMLRL